MQTSERVARPLSGVGVGLRPDHISIIKQQPKIAWLEILADNYLQAGSIADDHCREISALFPLAQHSVGMSLGSTDPLNWDYLRLLRELSRRLEAKLISDHLCWVSHQGTYLHDLLPLPYTQEAVNHVAERILAVQDFFQQRIAIENVSSYLSYKQSEMTEWEFLHAVAQRADCYILLDINNIYVSSMNHHFDPKDYLSHLVASRIAQFHLAGFTAYDNYLLDTHGSEVSEPVWDLYAQAVARFGDVPTLIEWDNDIPNFSKLLEQVERAEQILTTASAEVAL
jgi:uncharacterized protein